MKEMGSKIAVLVIVLVMLFLANLLFEATNDSVITKSEKNDSPLLYEDVLKEQEDRGGNLPQFENFLVGEDEISTATPKTINFDIAPLAKNFQELITTNYDFIGVNYAGHFSVVTWSCGDDCQNSIVIDTLTGDIVLYGLISTYGLSFSPESSLLINNVQTAQTLSGTSTVPTDYYVLNDNDKLELVAKAVAGKDLLSGCINATTTARNFLTNEIFVYPTPCHVPYGWEVVSN